MIYNGQQIPTFRPGISYLEGLVSRFGGRTLQDLPGNINNIRPEIDKAQQIIFNIPQGGLLDSMALTMQEYAYILSRPDLLQKTIFISGATY